MISIFDICNFTDFIKKNYKDISISLIINDIRNFNVKDVLSNVLDLEFFETFFDEFLIQTIPYSDFNKFGKCYHNDMEYIRVYSGRNGDVENNIPGCFDLFAHKDFLKEFKEYNINYFDFTFNEDDEREILQFPIFNKKVIERAEEIKQKYLGENFESICYRTNITDFEKLRRFRNKLDETIDKKNNYFICSNSSEVKKFLSELDVNSHMVRGFVDEKYHLDGYPTGHNQLTDAFNSVTELYLLGESKKIYYDGEMPWVSLFVWYARTVKKIKFIY
jgi:hypothetical protein